MIAKIFALTIFATLAVAYDADPVVNGGINNSCNTGAVQCCNSVQSAKDAHVSQVLGLLDIVVDDVTAQVGLSCSPITAAGIAGNSCSSQPVCCEQNNFNGLVNVACTPLNANL